MKTSIDFLKKILAPFHPEHIRLKNEELYINAIKFLNETQAIFEPDVLYIGKDLMNAGIFARPNLLNLISIGGTTQVDSRDTDLNLIVLKEDVDIHDVFNVFQNALSKEQQLDFWSSKLLSMLAADKPLQNLMDLGYEMLENPMSVSDIYGECIGITNKVEIADDVVWNEFVTSGYLSPDTFASFTKVNLGKMIDASEEPIIWHDSYSKYRRILVKIKIGNRHAGTLGVIEYNRPFGEDDLRLASLFCNVVAAYLQKSEPQNHSNRTMYENFMKELLSGEIAAKEVLEEKLRALNLHSKQTLCAISIELCKEYDHTELSLSLLSSLIEGMIAGSHTAIYNQMIFLLLSSNNKKYSFNRELEILEKFLEDKKVQAGISSLFHKPECLSEHYMQSVKALELGKKINPEKNIYFYDDYSIYHVLEGFSSQQDFLEFCHPSLLALIKYDGHYNTAFTQTLYTYINTSNSITDTSSILSVHRNTVVYQIKKIRDITGIDFENSNVVLQLQISFKLLELNKAFNGGVYEN